MRSITTLGRRPTLREVLEYYEREDFLDYLEKTCQTRRVVLVVKTTDTWWKPDWLHGGITARELANLGSYIRAKIAEAFPTASLDDPLTFYPSFHQTHEQWQAGMSKGMGEDCVFESDPPSWRDAFWNIVLVLELMDQFKICYHHKFSGSRSLHVVIPAETLTYACGGARQFGRKISAWVGSQVTHTPYTNLRMPFSLKEDTGLVSLPIPRGGLANFRPWQANLHLVEIREVWAEESFATAPADMNRFVESLKRSRSGAEVASMEARKQSFFLPDRKLIQAKYQGCLERLNEFKIPDRHRQKVSDQKKILESVVTGEEISAKEILWGLDHSDPDVQWLTVEAALLSGTGLPETIFDKMLELEEPYAVASMLEVFLRFERETLNYLLRAIHTQNLSTRQKEKVIYLFVQSQSMRETLISTLLQGEIQSYDILIAAACLTGTMLQDWHGAFRLLEQVKKAGNLSAREQAQFQALELMSTMSGKWHLAEPEKETRLAALGRDIVDLLLLAADNSEAYLKRATISVLAAIADERAIDLFVRCLEDGESKVRESAVTGLIRLGEPAVDALIRAAASEREEVRRYAIRCLAKIGSLRVRTALLRALEDSDKKVIRHALSGLKFLATAEDRERLEQVLREESGENAKLAAEILEARGLSILSGQGISRVE